MMSDTFKVEFNVEYDQNLYVKGEGKTCRLCLCDGATFKIFSDLLMVNYLQSSCEIEVLEDDGFPDHMCSKCCSIVEIATNFKKQCQESDQILRNSSNPLSEEVGCTVKEEYQSDDGINNNYCSDYDSCDEFKPEIRHKKRKSTKEIGENGRKTRRKTRKKTADKNYEEIKLEADDVEASVQKKHKIISKSTLCPFCGKLFLKMASLNSHMKTHKTDRPFTCDICSKTFFEKWHLHEHKKIHTDVKSYPCEACGKLFKTPRDTKRHTDMVHKKSRTVQCTLCKKYLSSSSGLKLHMKSHTGEKEFQCDICNRKFISKPCLTLHLRVHTGEKPYSCKFCEGKFAILKTLKEHERIHTGETPYNCPVCKKGFSQKSNMKSHFRYNHRGVEFSLERKKLLNIKSDDEKDSMYDPKEIDLKSLPLGYI